MRYRMSITANFILLSFYKIEFLNITSTFLGTRTITFAPSSIVMKPNPEIITSRFAFPVSSLTAFTLFKSKFSALCGGVKTEPNCDFQSSFAFSVLVL